MNTIPNTGNSQISYRLPKALNPTAQNSSGTLASSELPVLCRHSAQNFPSELVHMFMSYLSPLELVSTLRVCRSWHNVGIVFPMPYRVEVKNETELQEARMFLNGRKFNTLELKGGLFTEEKLQEVCKSLLPRHLVLRCQESVTDALLEHVGQMTQLESLSLYAAHNITHAGLAYLSPLTQLKSLNLGSCSGIKNAAVATVRKKLPQLEFLSLNNCYDITDECLPDILELKELRDLDLGGCNRITNVSTLAQLPHLNSKGGYGRVVYGQGEMSMEMQTILASMQAMGMPLTPDTGNERTESGIALDSVLLI
jgi:hypothetical protein